MSEIIDSEKINLLTEILGNAERRSYIEVVKKIQNHIIDGIKENQIDEVTPPVVHHFGPGVYMRQMDAKAGTLVISKMHSTEHFNILLKGAVSLITEDGIKTVYAGQVMLSQPGTKRIGYFHEDSSWLTIHPTDETDPDVLEDELTVPEEEIDSYLARIGFQDKEFIA
ncbi:hypothetical protein [Acinetobacter sp. YH01020]|uniref:hypothetical protein n=1 Tax=Acinetobacter sp. YH01020 TaxID=2601034 RepID=UPI0015D143BE|nr:hypothetical protein [Acinetobacter sp. YH01020]